MVIRRPRSNVERMSNAKGGRNALDVCRNSGVVLDIDPFERFHEARGFDGWQENRSWAIQPALSIVNAFVESFEDYPARLKSFNADTSDMVDKMMSPTAE